MELISSRDVLDFLSQSAPRAWVKRILFALIVDQEVTAFATGARSVAEAFALGEVLRVTEEAKSKEESDQLIREHFSADLAAKLLKAGKGDYVKEAVDEWSSSDEVQAIDPGYFLYSRNIDWEKGTIETELDTATGFDWNFFDESSDLLVSSFRDPTFHITFTGLCFSREAIEMLLPLAQLAPATEGQSETRSRIGRPRTWDWDGAMMHLLKIAQTPDGLPSGGGAQAGIEKIIADWFFATNGDAPAESSIRSHANRVMTSLGRKA